MGLALACRLDRSERHKRHQGGVPGERDPPAERVGVPDDGGSVAARAARAALEDAAGEVAKAGHRPVPAKRLGAVRRVALADDRGAVSRERIAEAVEVVAGEIAETGEARDGGRRSGGSEQERSESYDRTVAGRHHDLLRAASICSSARCAVSRTSSAGSRSASRSAGTAAGSRRAPTTRVARARTCAL